MENENIEEELENSTPLYSEDGEKSKLLEQYSNDNDENHRPSKPRYSSNDEPLPDISFAEDEKEEDDKKKDDKTDRDEENSTPDDKLNDEELLGEENKPNETTSNANDFLDNEDIQNNDLDPEDLNNGDPQPNHLDNDYLDQISGEREPMPDSFENLNQGENPIEGTSPPSGEDTIMGETSLNGAGEATSGVSEGALAGEGVGSLAGEGALASEGAGAAAAGAGGAGAIGGETAATGLAAESGAALLTNPVGWIILGIVAVVLIVFGVFAIRGGNEGLRHTDNVKDIDNQKVKNYERYNFINTDSAGNTTVTIDGVDYIVDIDFENKELMTYYQIMANQANYYTVDYTDDDDGKDKTKISDVVHPKSTATVCDTSKPYKDQKDCIPEDKEGKDENIRLSYLETLYLDEIIFNGEIRNPIQILKPVNTSCDKEGCQTDELTDENGNLVVDSYSYEETENKGEYKKSKEKEKSIQDYGFAPIINYEEQHEYEYFKEKGLDTITVPVFDDEGYIVVAEDGTLQTQQITVSSDLTEETLKDLLTNEHGYPADKAKEVAKSIFSVEGTEYVDTNYDDPENHYGIDYDFTNEYNYMIQSIATYMGNSSIDINSKEKMIGKKTYNEDYTTNVTQKLEGTDLDKAKNDGVEETWIVNGKEVQADGYYTKERVEGETTSETRVTLPDDTLSETAEEKIYVDYIFTNTAGEEIKTFSYEQGKDELPVISAEKEVTMDLSFSMQYTLMSHEMQYDADSIETDYQPGYVEDYMSNAETIYVADGYYITDDDINTMDELATMVCGDKRESTCEKNISEIITTFNYQPQSDVSVDADDYDIEQEEGGGYEFGDSNVTNDSKIDEEENWKYVEKYSKMYGVDPDLYWALLGQESSYGANSTDCNGGSAACGPAQIEMGKHTSVEAFNQETQKLDTFTISYSSSTGGESDDQTLNIGNTEDNIRAGVMIFAQTAKTLQYNPLLTLVGYNYGPAGAQTMLAYSIKYEKYENVRKSEKESKKYTLKEEDYQTYDWMENGATTWYSNANYTSGTPNADTGHSKGYGCDEYNEGSTCDAWTHIGPSGDDEYVQKILENYQGSDPYIIDEDGEVHSASGTVTTIKDNNLNVEKEIESIASNEWFKKSNNNKYCKNNSYGVCIDRENWKPKNNYELIYKTSKINAVDELWDENRTFLESAVDNNVYYKYNTVYDEITTNTLINLLHANENNMTFEDYISHPVPERIYLEKFLLESNYIDSYKDYLEIYFPDASNINTPSGDTCYINYESLSTKEDLEMLISSAQKIVDNFENSEYGEEMDLTQMQDAINAAQKVVDEEEEDKYQDSIDELSNYITTSNSNCNDIDYNIINHYGRNKTGFYESVDLMTNNTEVVMNVYDGIPIVQGTSSVAVIHGVTINEDKTGYDVLLTQYGNIAPSNLMTLDTDVASSLSSYLQGYINKNSKDIKAGQIITAKEVLKDTPYEKYIINSGTMIGTPLEEKITIYPDLTESEEEKEDQMEASYYTFTLNAFGSNQNPEPFLNALEKQTNGSHGTGGTGETGGTGGGSFYGNGQLTYIPMDEYYITQHFGATNSGGLGYEVHAGIDMDHADYDPIYAAGDGVVKYAGCSSADACGSDGANGSAYGVGFGQMVMIDHGNGLTTIYGHMANTPLVQVGDEIKAGDQVGVLGNTGNSFGSHFHFEVQVSGNPVNPNEFLPIYENAIADYA